MQLIKLGQLLANVVAYIQLTLRSDHLVVLLIFEWLAAIRVVTNDFATLGLVLLNV